MNFKLLSQILVLCALSAAVIAVEANNQLYQQLFDRENMEPSQTLALIKEAYASPDLDESAKRELEALIYDSEMDVSKCGPRFTANAMKIAEKLYESHYNKVPKLKSYLKHYQDKLYTLCQEKYMGELSETVSHVDQQDQEEIAKLMESIETVKPQPLAYLDIDADALQKGVGLYLREKNGDSESGFDESFNSMVQMCKRVDETIGALSVGHSQLIATPQPVDPIRAKWMTYDRLCFQINRDLADVRKGAEKAFKNKNSCFGSLKNLVRGKSS